jgi:hypothetical protein
MDHFVSTTYQSQQFFRLFIIYRHYDATVRAFVVKRLQSWAQTTQISAQITKEDSLFRQCTQALHSIVSMIMKRKEKRPEIRCFYSDLLSDSSSSSNDAKGQQLGHSTKSSPSPSSSSIPLTIASCKTPLHDHRYGSMPSAALVPQTDRQPRQQQARRRRNSSSSSSGTTCRPGDERLVDIVFEKKANPCFHTFSLVR